MKLAFHGTIDYGGQGTFLIELTKHLSDKIEHIHIFPTSLSVGRHEIYQLYEGLPSNIEIHKSSNFICNFLKEINSFKNLDIVHVNYAIFGLSSMFAKKLHDTPYVYTIHSPPNMLFGSFLNRFIYRLELDVFLPVISKNAHLVTNSNYNRKIIRDKYGFEADVVYHGINTKKFGYYVNNSHRDFIINQLGLNQDDIFLLFVGRFHGYKDIPTLIRAMPKVIKQNKNIKLIIIGGGGDAYSQVKREIQKNEVDNQIIILNNVSNEDLLKYYAGADMFVFPSTGEGFGLIFLEAMACGLPVIAANAGASPEVVGDAGLLSNPRNSEDLADKIIELINNKELYEKLKEKGLERAKQFTWERTAEQYYEIYMKVLEDRDK